MGSDGINRSALFNLKRQFQWCPRGAAVGRFNHTNTVCVSPVPISCRKPKVVRIFRVNPEVGHPEGCQHVHAKDVPCLALIPGVPETASGCAGVPMLLVMWVDANPVDATCTAMGGDTSWSHMPPLDILYRRKK